PNPIYPTYPRVVVQLTPGQQQVVEWYQTYLGRYPDATGLRNWGGMLDAGYPRNAVLAGILGSAEYYQLKGGTPTRFVRGLCREVVGRWPTPLEQQDGVLRLSRGYSRTSLARTLLETPPTLVPIDVSPFPLVGPRVVFP